MMALLYAVALRFFLFEFKSFHSIRERLKKKNPMVDEFMSCSFCTGFWCGLFVHLYVYGITSTFIFFCLATGFVSFFLHLLMQRLLKGVK